MPLKTSLHATTLLVCGLLLACAAAGCNRGPKTPPLAKMTGAITLDGKPVGAGMIVFVPDVDKGTTGPVGVGAMDAGGHYTIFTLNQEGAIVGSHKVRIQDPMGQAWAVAPRYADENTSGLVAEVKAGQDNVIDFKLTTKP